MNDWIVNDGPEDFCFGCGQRNEAGMKLRFKRTGEASVETIYTAPGSYRGAEGVVHGGIQATLLDEVMGMAAHVALGHDDGRIVTVDFRLRYRKPTPTGVPLTVRGRLARRDGPHLFLEAEILNGQGTVLTEAEARWRHIGPRRSAERQAGQPEDDGERSDDPDAEMPFLE